MRVALCSSHVQASTSSETRIWRDRWSMRFSPAERGRARPGPLRQLVEGELGHVTWHAGAFGCLVAAHQARLGHDVAVEGASHWLVQSGDPGYLGVEVVVAHQRRSRFAGAVGWRIHASLLKDTVVDERPSALLKSSLLSVTEGR